MNANLGIARGCKAHCQQLNRLNLSTDTGSPTAVFEVLFTELEAHKRALLTTLDQLAGTETLVRGWVDLGKAND